MALSRRHCGPDCQAYHGLRLLFRSIGLTSEPADQIDFYRRALAQANLPDFATIVISGSSDTGVPELVASLTRERPLRILTVDLCQTPLRLVDQVLGRNDPRIRTEQADMRDWHSAAAVDVILSHSFFGQIAPPDRPAIVRNWFGLLRPGGSVITVNRLRSAAHARSLDAADHGAFEQEVMERLHAADDTGVIGRIGEDVLRATIRRYARNRTSYPVGLPGDFAELFTSAGFRMVHLETATGPTRVTGLSGPSLATGGLYCHLVAQRPGQERLGQERLGQVTPSR